MELIMWERAKVMAAWTAKVSAIRGDETEVTVAACWDEETRSSVIQPSPALPVVEFHAASVRSNMITKETKQSRPRMSLLRSPLVARKVLYEPSPIPLGSSWTWEGLHWLLMGLDSKRLLHRGNGTVDGLPTPLHCIWHKEPWLICSELQIGLLLVAHLIGISKWRL